MPRPTIWEEGKWRVEAGHERWYLIHRDLPGWVAEVVEKKVWEKKYKSDPKTFKEMSVARRLKALEAWWQKLAAQQDTIENEMDILKSV